MTHFDSKRRKVLQQLISAISLSIVGQQNFPHVGLMATHQNYPSIGLEEQWQPISKGKAINGKVLDRYATLLALCWRLLKGNEWVTVAYLLPTFLSEVETVAQQPSSHQKIFAGFAAQAYILKSIVVGHQDNLAAKLIACDAAIEYSRFAENPEMEVTALIQQAVTFDYRKQHQKALHSYQQAFLQVKNVPPLLSARILAGLAGSYARCGQEEYEAQRYFDEARKKMPAQPEMDPSFLYADCGQFTLPLWEGRIFFAFDQFDSAYTVFAQAKNHTDIPERIRTEFLNHLLETSIAQGDLDQSILCLREAGKAAINLKSERRQREVLDASQSMLHRWRQDRKRIQDAIAEIFVE